MSRPQRPLQTARKSGANFSQANRNQPSWERYLEWLNREDTRPHYNNNVPWARRREGAMDKNVNREE